MKKALLATSALMLTAGIASADVSLNGYGRFGLDYVEPGAAVPVGQTTSKTSISYRMRINIDASTEADNGLAFGGRLRIQSDDDKIFAGLNSAMLYVTYEGLRVEVGNANTAFDSAALLYAPEIGFQSRSFGDSYNFNYYSFATGAFANTDRVGVLVSYSIAGVNLRASYVDPNQTLASGYKLDAGVLTNVITPTADASNRVAETSFSADYTTSGWTVSAAYVQDGKGISGNNNTFVGVAYDIDADTNVGLNYIDNGLSIDAATGLATVDAGKTYVLYGSRNFGPITAKAYVADNNAPANVKRTAYGLGASYDLGGAVLAAAVERGFDNLNRGDIGVTFNF
jgi:outer membrane protein OmpU